MKKSKKKTLMIDLEQSRKETIEKWSKLGLLEGLDPAKRIQSDVFVFTQPNENQKIKEDPKQIIDD